MSPESKPELLSPTAGPRGSVLSPQAAARWLRGGLAFIWLATALGVVHPYYREVGAEYLDRLGLPSWPMTAACVAELLLGLWVASGKGSTGAAVVQAGLILGFTTVLACLDPWL